MTIVPHEIAFYAISLLMFGALFFRPRWVGYLLTYGEPERLSPSAYRWARIFGGFWFVVVIANLAVAGAQAACLHTI
ncbi:MAG: hypothetical protein WC729_17835 [Sphingomonas sp.]|uniref:hypothetical protein n=1 Tax=Sphingomonas sp. TaxID=28214 RepID=UPI0035617D72